MLKFTLCKSKPPPPPRPTVEIRGIELLGPDDQRLGVLYLDRPTSMHDGEEVMLTIHFRAHA